MIDGIGIEIKNLAEVGQYLDQMPDDTFEDTKKVFQKAVLAADRRVKSFFGRRLKVRTGGLRRSLGTKVEGTNLKNLIASFYSMGSVSKKGASKTDYMKTVTGRASVVYAPIQEFGGTIKAINKYRGVPGGPYLNIPTGSNKTAAGVMRKTAKMIFDEGGYIQKSRRGNWGVFLGNKMMFVLKKKVHIPPRLGMRSSAERQIPTILSSLKDLIGEG